LSRLRVELKWKGIPELKQNLDKLGDDMIKKAESLITRESARILAVAIDRAPKGKTGQLARNVQLIPAKIEVGIRGAQAIEAGFVFLQNYAHIQHERMDFRHESGRSKYAESAIKDEGRAFLEAVSRGVRSFLA
jgi:hypothetical protein